ncbi:MAG: nucleoside 2-deoxyribosyltransferase [Verrucomicrobia bacterium]|nr:nucleoside 2-deoxyribosyltransferase [Verrucomicrobiota bacterium]
MIESLGEKGLRIFTFCLTLAMLTPLSIHSQEETKSLSVYFAGALFNSKDLLGNQVLAEAIEKASMGRYECRLPQDIEVRVLTAQNIRDTDLKEVLAADLAIFNYDGTELDSGTVVEYLFAKFADIPAVILRTDFRKGGDQEENPWNLMSSFFPRTEVVLIDSMALYKQDPSNMIPEIARQVVVAMDEVVTKTALMPAEISEAIYRWLTIMPGFKEESSEIVAAILEARSRKLEKKLL